MQNYNYITTDGQSNGDACRLFGKMNPIGDLMPRITPLLKCSSTESGLSSMQEESRKGLVLIRN